MEATTTPTATAGTDTLRRDQSVAKNLFFGEIVEENLFPYPKMRERDREMLGAMLDAIDDFLAPQHSELKHYDRNAEQPPEFIQALRDMGLFGLIIPEEFGGLGLSNAAYARVLSQTSSHDSSVSLTIGAHSSIGMKGLLLFGTDAQKAKYLPKLASGETIAAFCLTEAGAGSDAASVRTKASLNSDGTWTLNGEKIWITNGGIADFYTVFAKSRHRRRQDDRVHRRGETGWRQPRSARRQDGHPRIEHDDRRLQRRHRAGRPGARRSRQRFQSRDGDLEQRPHRTRWRRRRRHEDPDRLACAQARDRKQFGRPVAEFGLVREKIAQMTIDCFAAESAVWMVAHYIDSGCTDYSVKRR